MSGDGEIRVNLADLENAARRFKAEAGNIETAANGADQGISSLRSMKSKRVNLILEAWDRLLKDLRANVENVERIADEQVAAENAFRAADGQ